MSRGRRAPSGRSRSDDAAGSESTGDPAGTRARPAQGWDLGEHDARLYSLLALLPAAVYACDAEGRIVFYNQRAAELWGREPALHEDSQKYCGAYRVYLADGRRIDAADTPMAAALREGRSYRNLEATLQRPDGSRFVASINIDPLFDENGQVTGAINVFQDLSERVAAEESVQFLSQASAALSESIDYGETLNTVARLAVPALADWCIIDMLTAQGGLEPVAIAHRDAQTLELTRQLRREYPLKPADRDGVPRVVLTGRSELYPTFSEQWLQDIACDAGHLEMLRKLPMRSGLIVPLAARGRTFGALTLLSEESGRYGEKDLAFAEDLARRCASAVDNANLYRAAQAEIERRQSIEQQLRESESRLRFTLEAARVATWEWDIRSGVVRRSHDGRQMYGPAANGFDGTLEGFLCQVHSEDRAAVLEQLQRSVRTGDPYHAEFRINSDENPPRWLEGKGRVVFDSDGRPERMVGIGVNITERKQAEQELHRREQEFRALVENSPDIVARFDRELRHVYVNPAVVGASGRQPQEFVGRTNREMGMPDAACADWEAVLRDVFESGEERSFEFSFPSPDGIRHYLSRLVPERSEGGRVETVLGVTRDITQRRDAEEQVRGMNETLELRVAQRTAQLRRLTRQLALAEQKERRRLSQLLHDDLQQLLVAASMRVGLLEKRLDERGDSGMARDVRELLVQSIEMSRSLTQELSPPILYDSGLGAALPWLARLMEQRHGLVVETDLDEAVEPQDEETRIILFSAARELLFNVVKHAQTQAAVLSVSRAGECVRLVVEDRGIGIDTQRFGRELGNEFGLLGLRERVQYLGGRLQLDGRPGCGTRVTVDLPWLSLPDAPTESVETARPPPERTHVVHDRSVTRVLLADDHQILRDGVASILAEHSDVAVVAEAADGSEAIDLTLLHQPDVVVMDITMPGMNGIEATRRITRRMPQVAVVGLSMHNSPDLAREMLEAGAREVLVKDGPFDALLDAIRRSASPRARIDSSAAAASTDSATRPDDPY